MTARRALVLIIVIEALFCAAAAIAGGRRPNTHFIEGGIVTWVNMAQIVVLSLFAVAVYRARAAEDDPAGAIFWILVAVGALYLAADEALEWHESIGQYLRDLKLPRPPLVNGWGDFVLALYAIPVLGICWRFRREILVDHEVLRVLLLGGGVLVLSQLIDTLGVHQGRERFWWSVSEESAKLIGFGIILGAMIIKWSNVRRRASVAPEASASA